MNRSYISLLIPLTIFCYPTQHTLSAPHAPSASKQPPGKIAGVLLDPNGARVIYANIVIESETLKKSLSPNDEGTFSVELAPGTYRVRIDSNGFRRFESKAIEVRPDSMEHIEIHLQPMPSGPHHYFDGTQRIEPENAPIGKKIRPRKISVKKYRRK